MKVTVKHSPPPPRITAKDMLNGQVGVIAQSAIPSYIGLAVIKTFHGLASLDGLKVWDSSAPLGIELLPPDSSVTLEQINL